jgi:hypothetical protein
MRRSFSCFPRSRRPSGSAAAPPDARAARTFSSFIGIDRKNALPGRILIIELWSKLHYDHFFEPTLPESRKGQ